ncbi:hypothetical protein KIF24_29850 [Micromonospora sp. Llam7]|uniref:hypothetical protein n=1 Tax=Micromonospora tarapacensis TaxID=2835305 RepID=UPI001C82C69C|nr:hypothetical protein [Micromonospora tarapacensis]
MAASGVDRLSARRAARWASAATRTDPPIPTIAAYGAMRWADTCSGLIAVSLGTARKYATATSNGPAAPEAVAPTRRPVARTPLRAASAPISSADPSDRTAPGQ